jgi:hypothetical protein
MLGDVTTQHGLLASGQLQFCERAAGTKNALDLCAARADEERCSEMS